MGFFSWKCAVSDKSIANVFSGQPDWQSECYLVTPSETLYEPHYEGYGVFEGKDVYELLGDGNRDKGIKDYFEGIRKFDIKVVLAKHYKGETYDQLRESEDCEHQGYFYRDNKEDEDED